MVACVVVFSFDARRAAPCRHVTKIPSPQLLLFHTLTNRDASNPLECPLTKTAGSHPSTQTFFSLSVLPWPHVSRLPYLPSSVSRNCFACPSHKNNGGGGGILPVSEFFARHSLSSSPFFSDCSTLFCTFLRSSKSQLVSFQTLPHSLPKNKKLRSGCAPGALRTDQRGLREPPGPHSRIIGRHSCAAA